MVLDGNVIPRLTIFLYKSTYWKEIRTNYYRSELMSEWMCQLTWYSYMKCLNFYHLLVREMLTKPRMLRWSFQMINHTGLRHGLEFQGEGGSSVNLGYVVVV
jgi:hypothetical protein